MTLPYTSLHLQVAKIYNYNGKTLDSVVFSVLLCWVLFAVLEVPLISHCQRNSHATALPTLLISHTLQEGLASQL